jgi:transposase-like protein
MYKSLSLLKTFSMIEELIQKVNKLGPEEKRKFIEWLNSQLPKEEDTVLSVIETRKNALKEQGLVCPHCKSSEIYGHGTFKERKRYQCKQCRKTFNELSGTSIDKIHLKDKWEAYINCMIEGSSLRESSEKVGICLRTSFNWRHRILSSLNEVGCSHMEGIIEADETFFLFSEKGNKNLHRKARKRGTKASKDGMNKEHVNVIVASDRKGNKAMNVGNLGVITKKTLDKAIGKWINKTKSILCSDAHKTFQAYAKENKMPHKMLYARKKQYVIDNIYHVQNVNSLHSQLKKFMIKFNGVATKYLQNYVNYYKAFSSLKKRTEILAISLLNNDVYYGTYKTNLHYYAT